MWSWFFVEVLSRHCSSRNSEAKFSSLLLSRSVTRRSYRSNRVMTGLCDLASENNAPLAMHYLSDIRPEPARGLISFWYQTWGLISFWYQTWGLISFWYQTCDGSGFEFVRTNYVQHQSALQLFSTTDRKFHVCADSHWLLVDLTK